MKCNCFDRRTKIAARTLFLFIPRILLRVLLFFKNSWNRKCKTWLIKTKRKICSSSRGWNGNFQENNTLILPLTARSFNTGSGQLKSVLGKINRNTIGNLIPFFILNFLSSNETDSTFKLGLGTKRNLIGYITHACHSARGMWEIDVFLIFCIIVSRECQVKRLVSINNIRGRCC